MTWHGKMDTVTKESIREGWRDAESKGTAYQDTFLDFAVQAFNQGAGTKTQLSKSEMREFLNWTLTN